MKNVLVISTSLRTNSNSEALADAYLRGAADAGHHTEKVTLRGKEIQFCRGVWPASSWDAASFRTMRRRSPGKCTMPTSSPSPRLFITMR